tara:strand:+ start:107 stop:403 length:297 start_codon:yes stop_codon:yes gene_type:complete
MTSMDEMMQKISIGTQVFCDFCNGGADTKGGVMLGSYAVCGNCCERNGYYDTKSDEIDEVFDKNKTFKVNVLDRRKRTTGSSEGIITITKFPNITEES